MSSERWVPNIPKHESLRSYERLRGRYRTQVPGTCIKCVITGACAGAEFQFLFVATHDVQPYEVACAEAAAAGDWSKAINERKLISYGLYKQITVGDNTTSQPWAISSSRGEPGEVRRPCFLGRQFLLGATAVRPSWLPSPPHTPGHTHA